MATAGSLGSNTYKVKRYECLFTTQVRKKQKTFHDGFIRHHHFNSRAFLLSEDGGELSTTFYRSPAGGPTSLFENDFVLGGEVEFEDGYLVEVGQLVWEGETNLDDIHSATRQARSKAASEALAWASSEDLVATRPSLSADLESNGKGAVRSLVIPRPATDSLSGSYRGFGIASPETYAGGKTPSLLSGNRRPSTSNATSSRFASSSTTISASPKPYSRPSPVLPQPSLPAASMSTPYRLGTPLRSVSSPFRPPRIGTPTPKSTGTSARKSNGPTSASSELAGRSSLQNGNRNSGGYREGGGGARE